MKFTINKSTGVRRAFLDNGKCVAVFGTAVDLLHANMLLEILQGHEHKIVVVQAPDFRVTEHETIGQAKDFIGRFYYSL